MAYSTKLPSRFPVGTKFVIESRRGGAKGQTREYSRHLEFPDGTLLALPAGSIPRLKKARHSRVRRRRV